MIIYADGASLDQIGKLPVDGFTFNPTLMKKAGITRMKDFAVEVLQRTDKPVSFEVLADDFDEMEQQAYEIASWGENVFVKIPITNTKGESSIDLIDRLSDLRLNITAVMTEEQLTALQTVDRPHHIISIFCGRISDTGRAPPYIDHKKYYAKVLWASTRHLGNIRDAEVLGYDIITMSPELIGKLHLIDKDLRQYSLETVQQFHFDGKGITL